MPGVVTRTAVRSGPSAFDDAASSTFFVLGLTERGPSTEPRLLRSMADFKRLYGNRVTYGFLYDSVQTFFEEGGTRAYAQRVVGPAATAGTLVLQDRNATTPQPVLSIDAYGEGAWSENVTVTVSDGAQPGLFDISIAYDEDVELFFGLSSAAEAVAQINANSAYVRASLEVNTTAAPENIPAVITSAALSAGTDDRASVATDDYLAALDLLPKAFGVGAVAIPGQPATAVVGALIDHCRETGRIALTAPATDQTVEQAISIAGGVRSGFSNEDYAGLFYPWVVIPSDDGTSVTRTVPPEGYVAGVRARAHIEDGPWRAPAGEIAAARYVLSPAQILSRAEGDTLDAAGVSAIRVIAGSTRLYGWRSLSADTQNWALLTGRDTINHIVFLAEERLEKYVFRTIDGRGLLFAEINADMVAMLDPMRLAGGLYETDADLGYSVDTGSSVNTPITIARNEANVAIGARVSPTGAVINLLVTKVGVGAAA